MLYYQVKKESDQVQVFTKLSRFGRMEYKGTLIGLELFTKRELTSRLKLQLEVNVNFIKDNFDLIECSSKKTFWIFGTRKQITT
jgi:hypothetical protein